MSPPSQSSSSLPRPALLREEGVNRIGFKPVAAFFFKVILLYALLMIPWPGVSAGYGYLFRACGTAVFHTFGSAGRVEFRPAEPNPGEKDPLDFEIRLRNLRTQAGGTFTLERNTRKMGYLPTAFTVALILATPVPWPRRGWALLWGLVLISAFVGFQLTLHLVNAFSDPNVLNQFDLAPSMKRLLGIALKVFVLSPVTAYIVPIFVWILVAFRRGDWAKLLATPAAPTARDG